MNNFTPVSALVGGAFIGGAAAFSGMPLATRKQALGRVFEVLVIAVGLYIVLRGIIALTA